MLVLLLCIGFALCKKRLYLSTSTSLFGPPLDINGKSMRYDFKGQYAVTSYSSDGVSHTQLGYDAPNSSTMLISRSPTDAKNYVIEYRLRFHKSERFRKRSGGIAFFFTKDQSIKRGAAFGVSEEFDGGLVAIDLKGDSSGKPFVGAVVREGIKYNPRTRGTDIMAKEFIDESLLKEDEELIVRLEQEGGILTVWMGRPRGERKYLSISSTLLGKGYYVGIAGSSEGGSLLTRLYGIRFYSVVHGPKYLDESVAPRKRLGKLVWVLLLLAAGAVVYYLFCNYKKYK